MQTCSEKSPLFCEQQLGVGCTLQALGFQILCQGTALFSFLHNAVNQEINDMRKKKTKKKFTWLEEKGGRGPEVPD